MSSTSINATGPWWKFGYVWLVIAGPVIVIVASFVTFFLASQGMDTVVQEPPQQSKAATADSSATGSLAPALQARNHAATGVKTQP